MAKQTTAASIVKWAEGKQPAESPSYTRLTDADRVTILTLHDKGLTQTEIAKRLARSVSTINDVIQTYAPTVELAKRKLDAAALRMAENVIENGDPDTHLKALAGRGVLHSADSSGVSVIINGFVLHGTAKPETVEADAVSPVVLEQQGES